MEEYSAIILAAGYSSRMGEFKPLMKIGNKTIVEHLINTVRSAGISNIVVVTGYNKDLLESYLEPFKISTVYNEKFSEGMFTSIQKGIEEVQELVPFSSNKLKGCFLIPVDCPLVPSEIFPLLAESVQVNETQGFAVPCYKGKKGHPLLISSRFFDEILKYEGEQGLKGMMKPYESLLTRVETPFESVVFDIDTKEAYEEIVDFFNKDICSENGEKQLTFEELLLKFKGNIFLARHGETEQHKEKIFIGQTDVPLSPLGKQQAKGMAHLLKSHGHNIGSVFFSDLKRTAETAEIIIDKSHTMKLTPVKEFREINLSGWDGKFISEIKEKFPEEYKLRGENILTYKIDVNSENYYDLQYRVMKKLLSILATCDPSEDILIVAHSGVIKVILANILGITLDQSLKMDLPKGSLVKLTNNKMFVFKR